jgi:lipoprotein-anchoring transpeptidase ErfK/SrfK
MKISSRFSLALGAVVAVLVLLAGPAAGQGTLKIWFLKGEQLTAVARPGSTATDAAKALLAGPTPAESKVGFRTYVPQGTSLNSVAVADGVATVDLTIDFGQGSPESLTARLSQLVRTVSGVEGITKVQLLLNGGIPFGRFGGISVAQPLTAKYLETPDIVPPVSAPKTAIGPVIAGLSTTQSQFVKLGYMVGPDITGRDGPETQTAVLAFQKWEGLTPDGVLGPITRARLKTAVPPTPITQAPGRRVEVLLDRQVALAIVDNKVIRVIPVSTGKPSTPTPPGDFKVYAKYPRWWSTPFREWLLWAMPFNNGIALHEFPDVPSYAASHGCVREMSSTSKWMYDFGYVGMPVKVIAVSR